MRVYHNSNTSSESIDCYKAYERTAISKPVKLRKGRFFALKNRIMIHPL